MRPRPPWRQSPLPQRHMLPRPFSRTYARGVSFLRIYCRGCKAQAGGTALSAHVPGFSASRAKLAASRGHWQRRMHWAALVGLTCFACHQHLQLAGGSKLVCPVQPVGTAAGGAGRRGGHTAERLAANTASPRRCGLPRPVLLDALRASPGDVQAGIAAGGNIDARELHLSDELRAIGCIKIAVLAAHCFALLCREPGGRRGADGGDGGAGGGLGGPGGGGAGMREGTAVHAREWPKQRQVAYLHLMHANATGLQLLCSMHPPTVGWCGGGCRQGVCSHLPSATIGSAAGAQRHTAGAHVGHT